MTIDLTYWKHSNLLQFTSKGVMCSDQPAWTAYIEWNTVSSWNQMNLTTSFNTKQKCQWTQLHIWLGLKKRIDTSYLYSILSLSLIFILAWHSVDRYSYWPGRWLLYTGRISKSRLATLSMSLLEFGRLCLWTIKGKRRTQLFLTKSFHVFQLHHHIISTAF